MILEYIYIHVCTEYSLKPCLVDTVRCSLRAALFDDMPIAALNAYE